MIVVSISGGLANQMFQYAFSLYLKEKGMHVLLDQSSIKPRVDMTCETTTLQDVFENVEIENMPPGKFPLISWKRRWNYLRAIAFLWGDKYIQEPTFDYYPDIYCKASKNCIFKGSWQCEKYFVRIKDTVLKHFMFKPFTDERNIILAEKMKKEESVAIHIRKGKDYTSEFLFQNTCSKEYYLSAIKYITSKIDKPTLYVFTDNQEWAKECLKDIEYNIIDWNPVSGKENYLDMQLMSLAKHNIISNSTYSWWGAWLNTSIGKIVIAPRIWFNPDMKLAMYSNYKIVCDNWIKL